MIKVFLNCVQKTKPHIKSETGLLLFVPTKEYLAAYLLTPCIILNLIIFLNPLFVKRIYSCVDFARNTVELTPSWVTLEMEK